jgi:hypothetical protein
MYWILYVILGIFALWLILTLTVVTKLFFGSLGRVKDKKKGVDTSSLVVSLAPFKEEIEEGKTFGEYLAEEKWIDTEVIIGGAEMPASFVWDNDNEFTEEGKEHFKPILEARYVVRENYIEVFCDNEDLGEDFVLTIAGYTPESRYNKLIKEK